MHVDGVQVPILVISFIDLIVGAAPEFVVVIKQN